MSLLLLDLIDGRKAMQKLRSGVSQTLLGSAEDCDICLSQAPEVAPYHAAIVRSSVYQVPILVDLAGASRTTRVNSRQVAMLSLLRQHDEIEIGCAHLEFWEVIAETLTADLSLVGKTCLVCMASLEIGQITISCPRCDSSHHLSCWLELEVCSCYGCGYPVQEVMRRCLGRHGLRFERLVANSGIVWKGETCSAGRPRDRVAFKATDLVTRCPQCETLFHAECWFNLGACPRCSFSAADLLRSVLFTDDTDFQRTKNVKERDRQ